MSNLDFTLWATLKMAIFQLVALGCLTHEFKVEIEQHILDTNAGKQLSKSATDV